MKKIVLFSGWVAAALIVSSSACATADAPTVVDDAVLRRALPQFPKAVVFTTNHLDLLAAVYPNEKSLSLDSKAKYLLEGDFNQNGRPDVVVSGLESGEPANDRLAGFVAVLEKEGGGFKPVFVEKFPISIKAEEGGEAIRNLMLDLKEGAIQVGFAAATDFVGFIKWDGRAYKFEIPKME